MSQAYMHYAIDADGVLTATMDDPNGRVNVMNGVFLKALADIAAKLEAERDRYRGVILTSAKSTFFAGGDLDEILAVNAKNRDAYFNKVEAIKSNFRRLETIGLPLVAAINGAALGGGYEICLACHHRVAADNSKTIIGLPEVTLGLLPGGGGIIRLTRKIGLEAALPFLLTGKALNPHDALNHGLIDEVTSDAASMMAAAKSWIMTNPAPVQPWDEAGFTIPGSTTSIDDVVTATANKIKAGEYDTGPAPATILKCATDSVRNDLDTASTLETECLVDLANSAAAKQKIKAFFERTRNKGKS